MTKNKWLLLLLIGLGLVLAGCGLDREGTIVYDTGYPSSIGGDSDDGRWFRRQFREVAVPLQHYQLFNGCSLRYLAGGASQFGIKF